MFIPTAAYKQFTIEPVSFIQQRKTTQVKRCDSI